MYIHYVYIHMHTYKYHIQISMLFTHIIQYARTSYNIDRYTYRY